MPYDKTAIRRAIDDSHTICRSGRADVIRIVEAIIGETLDPPPPPERTYRTGMRFVYGSGNYILAAAGGRVSDGARITMINLETGAYYREPVPVRNSAAITEAEMRDICGVEREHFNEEIPF